MSLPGRGGSAHPGRALREPTARQEVAAALLRLWRPLPAKFSPGRARVRLNGPAAHYSERDAELEAFARPLWGVVPFAAGGGAFPDWDLYVEGLENGTDPAHPEYWGAAGDNQHAFVEMPPIALALTMCRSQVWDRLTSAGHQRLVAWLSQVNARSLHANNWLFFRVLVNLGLQAVGVGWDHAAVSRDLDQLESFYRGDGWYVDGNHGRFDYYNAFALHFYGLLYATLVPEGGPRAERWRQRADDFAGSFLAWFSRDGAAVPYGRSMTYRFGQGAFWGALAFAARPALPWGVIKGLYLRHLRWWLDRPIWHGDGTLSVGYGHAGAGIAEDYNAAGSPYWALKLFLPLALPPEHPFWTATEAELPPAPEVAWAPVPKLALFGTEQQRQVILLNGGQDGRGLRGGAAKYGKFAYSTHFGFNVPSDERGTRGASFDNALLFSRGDDRYHGRETVQAAEVAPDWLMSRWSPLPEAAVRTFLIPAPPWHVRVHQIVLRAPMLVVEGGFSFPRSDDPEADPGDHGEARLARGGVGGWSGLQDLLVHTGPGRRATLVRSNANTNLLHPRTDVPILYGLFSPGVLWLATAVLGLLDRDAFTRAWQAAPTAQLVAGALIVRRPDRPELRLEGWPTDTPAPHVSRLIGVPALRP